MKKLILLIGVLLLSIVGCSAIVETFGKEYKLVDDFFDQLDADTKQFFSEWNSLPGITSEQRSNIEAKRVVMSILIKEGRTSLKSKIKDYKDALETFGLNESIENYVESGLNDFRESLRLEMEEASGGRVSFKHTQINRGIVGSIWYQIRSHWIISLVVLGIIGLIYEKFEDVFGS